MNDKYITILKTDVYLMLDKIMYDIIGYPIDYRENQSNLYSELIRTVLTDAHEADSIDIVLQINTDAICNGKNCTDDTYEQLKRYIKLVLVDLTLNISFEEVTNNGSLYCVPYVKTITDRFVIFQISFIN